MHAKKICRYAISITFFIVIALIAPYVQANEVRLAWEPPTTNQDGTALDNLAGIRIHWGQTSGKYTETKEIKDPKATATTIASLDAGKTYYFVATAFDRSGNNSNFSNEVSATIPLLPPPPDTDGDGLTDEDERDIYRTNPNLVDSDGDGFADGTEISQGSNPADPISYPTLVELWVEAEDGEMTGPMTVARNTGASAGEYIEAASSDDSTTEQANGTAQYTFDVSEAGTYVIWARVHAPSSSNDSFFVSVDGGPPLLWDTQNDNSWVWDQVNNRDGLDPVLFFLDAGEHTLEILQREDGTQLDLLLITNDLVFVPIGTGDDDELPIGDDPVILPVQSVSASDWQGTSVPANTLDTDLNTRWSVAGDGQWLQFDLDGDNMTVSQVSIAWFKGNQRTAAFAIEVSINGQDWTEVHSGDSSGKTLELEPYAFDDVAARYVRIVGFGNSANQWNSITEVEIYGRLDDNDSSPPDGEDSEVLLVQSVSASDWQGTSVPANTLDTDLDTRWSVAGDGQWLQYDLDGDNMTVSQVSIAWFKGNQRTAAFAIEVSTNGQDWTEVHSGDSSGKTLDLEPYAFDDVAARHVRIVGFGNSANQWNSITEVEIYGTSK